MPSEIRVDKISSTASPYTPVFSTTGGALSHRNVIINGAMQVWQRRPSYSGTVDVSNGTNEDYKSVDRFKPTFGNSCGGGVSWSRSTEVPDIAGGDYFYDSLKVQTYSTTTPNTSKHATIDYRVEGHDMQRFGWGKTNKKDAVLSFYFKTNKTGIYSWYFRTPTGPRHRTISFTVSDTNWNRYSIALTADTVAIPDANTEGLQIRLNLINSPDNDYTSGTDSGWGTTEYLNDDGQVNFLDSASNILYLTGVQLELGSVATPFEHRTYQDELRKCLRYFQLLASVIGTGYQNGTNAVILSGGSGGLKDGAGTLGAVGFRVDPTVTGTFGNASIGSSAGTSAFSANAISVVNWDQTNSTVTLQTSSSINSNGAANNIPASVYFNSKSINFDAEL